ncbi:hypothetical protein STVA_41050 [Allostella vacuolata]|nr:hypothetical protein STVA_41050 [Stella vacuolata]
MDAVVLIEFDPEDEAAGELLLQLAALATDDRLRLAFVGRDSGQEAGTAGRRLVAIEIARLTAAEALVRRWRQDGTLPGTSRVRILALDREPFRHLLPPIFP